MNRLSPAESLEATKIPVSVLLDDIRSLLNVGSIFRTCDAFRIEKLYLCGITGQPPHRDIQKTALGATESVSWEYHAHAAEIVLQLKAEQGYKVVSIEQTHGSVPLHRFVPVREEKYLLILGNEVEGVNDQLLTLSDQAIEIPQAGAKHSLNVSVAAGIVLYHFFETYLK